MKKLVVHIPLIGKVSFNSIELNSLSKILAFANQKFLYLFVICLPFLVFLLKDEGIETSIFFGSLFVILPLISVFLVRMILYGSSVFVDPKGFVTVLVFALLTTTASISIDSPSTTNTFGLDSVRALSGVMIMAFIALYYSINVVVRDKNAFKRYFVALLAGNLTFTYLVIFHQFKFEYGIIILSGLPLLFAIANTYTKLKAAIYTYIIGVLLLLTFQVKMFESSTSLLPQELIILITLVCFFVITYALLSNSNQKLKKKDSWYLRLLPANTDSAIVINAQLILNSLPVVFISIITLYFFYSLFDTSSFNEFIKNTYENYSEGFKYLTDEKFKGFDLVQNFSFGLGSDNVSAQTSLFSSVLVSQGFFGVVAYISIFAYAIYNGLKLVINSYLKNSYFHFNVALLFNILFVSIFSIFAYPSIYLLVTWWISFSMLMSYNSFKESKEDKLYLERDLKIINKSKNSNLEKYLRVFGSVVVILLTLLIIYQLVISIGEV